MIDPQGGTRTKDRWQPQDQVRTRHLKAAGPGIRRDLEFEPRRLHRQRPMTSDLPRQGQLLDTELPLKRLEPACLNIQSATEVQSPNRHLEGRGQLAQRRPVQVMRQDLDQVVCQFPCLSLGLYPGIFLGTLLGTFLAPLLVRFQGRLLAFFMALFLKDLLEHLLAHFLDQVLN